MRCFLVLLCCTLVFLPCAQTPQVTSGSIRHFEKFYSDQIGPRNIDVWLPDGYSESKKYAVLYMHDGQMLFDSAITWNHQEWKVDETVSTLLKEQKIKDCIVVGIWNNGDLRHAEYFPQKVLGYLPAALRDSVVKDDLKGAPLSDKYLLFITRELKPFIDSIFSTYADKAHTFIAGSSMGALISMYAICEYPEVFGAAICMSTHWAGSTKHQNFSAFSNAFKSYLLNALPASKSHRFYFDHGSETLDSLYEPYQLIMDSVLALKGYNQTNMLSRRFKGDNHSEKSWSKRLSVPLLFMLQRP